MLGAIIGDIIGSPYETASHKRKDFTLFAPNCHPTDDGLMTIAVGCACVESDIRSEHSFKSALDKYMKEIGLMYPNAGFGKRFYQWMALDEKEPYGSKANGSAMRVSPVAWAANTLEEAIQFARWSAEITHNHPEGIRGAEAVAAAIFLARTGADKKAIKAFIEQNYYTLNFTIDEIRPNYRFDLSCENSVPQAIVCYLESDSYEDAIRTAVSLGGDCDTLAAMAGSIAEATFGIPEEITEQAFEFLDETLQDYYFSYADELYR